MAFRDVRRDRPPAVPRAQIPCGIWILLHLLLFAVPVFWRLGVPACTYHMEVLTQLASQEVWLRHHAGDRSAWLTPTLHGESRIRKPPGAVWVHGLAWRGMTPANSDAQARLTRARQLAAASMVLMLAGTALLGHTVAGPRTGWMAAVLLASTLAITKQARLASYDTYLMALSTLALGLSFAAVDRARRHQWG